MSKIERIEIPNIGDFSDVDVIEVLVVPGDPVAVDDPLITVESDKASMEIPSPLAGTVVELLTRVGDKVSEGSPILSLELDIEDTPSVGKQEDEPVQQSQAADNADMHAEVLVLGAGPGGYTAAFRAADLGKKTILVERHDKLGGVCLNVGCIPSKALLHAANVIEDARLFSKIGINFGQPRVDLDVLREWKESIVQRLTTGLTGLARQRKVACIQGMGHFLDPHHLRVEQGDGSTVISFDNCIIAAGSHAVKLPFLPDDPRIIDSTGALALESIPKRLLVIGGGIIGLEMAAVYHALGSKVSVVEMQDSLIPGADPDLVKPLYKHIAACYEDIMLNTGVSEVITSKRGLKVSFEGTQAPSSKNYDRILVAVGRSPNGSTIGAEHAGFEVDGKGFIPVDTQQRTNVSHIFAIGDIVGQPMLAHKATHEGKVAAEVCAGQESHFDARVIPSVAYTDPEVAWVGPTEESLKREGIQYEKAIFPWAASGRALSLGRDTGMTKLLCEVDSKRVIGAGIVGPNAGDLIAEVALAIEMGCDAEDLGLTIHPHPTLSETIAMAAEMIEGTVTDLYIPAKRK